ncbi:F-type H+-transporting ATPase subunit delta [Thermotomaculum hydrothermale]|uniref:ATP synthase subunit delta n=1 Tax=Thermotomaculum hydrothermale TaxID=981385 RepID=A0A7R6SZ71_9BACT|nr:ATP synthase F1 subunit delta [Thermotomaculum hydrothermale]BBB32520.1 F-type H+-transporting ATPase subunit delta [Thermotomaculum hydrothermale]
MIEKSIVNKYAKTLSVIIAEEKKPEEVFTNFFNVVDAICKEEASVKFFQNPSISTNIKIEKLSLILDELKFKGKYKNFLLKVIKNNRFKILFYLKDATKKYLYEELGIVEVNLIVPKPISKTTEKKFIELFEKKSGKKVKLNIKVDKSIIGGVVARIGSLLIDGSVKTKIFKIKEKLTGEL